MSLVLSLTDELTYQYENDEREGETNQHQSEQLDMFEISPVVKQMFVEGEGHFPRHEFLDHHPSKLSYITDNFVKLL